jgi:hypothetical protein
VESAKSRGTPRDVRLQRLEVIVGMRTKSVKHAISVGERRRARKLMD